MAGYIGHKPKISNYTVDEFTTTAPQAASGNFTLSQTVTDSKTLEISVGGIDQPQSAYSVTGTTLAFGASIITQGDIVIVRHAGESLMYPTLEASSVDSANIAAGAVDDAHLATGIDSTKLTGTIDNARISLDAAEIPSLATSKITTGTFDVARISAASVTQHVQAVDLSSVQNDIAILALHQAINENKSAYGLANSWIEQFENSTYITGLTQCTRVATSGAAEFIASVYSISGQWTSDANTQFLLHSNTSNGSTTFTDSSSNGLTITRNGAMVHSTAKAKFGLSSLAFNGSCGLTIASVPAFGNGSNYTFEYWIWYAPGNTSGARTLGNRNGSNANQFFVRPKTTYSEGLYGMQWGTGNTQLSGTTSPETQATSNWVHIAMVQEGNLFNSFANGVNISSRAHLQSLGSVQSNWNIGSMDASGEWLGSGGYMDEIRFSNSARYPGTTTFTPQTDQVANYATGSFTSTNIIPQDTTNKSEVGLVVLYKENAGTNHTLNTSGTGNLVGLVRANTGQAYQEVVLAPKGTFSSGVKIAIAPARSVTAGQALSYKLEFAGQASSSLETRVLGVAMTY